MCFGGPGPGAGGPTASPGGGMMFGATPAQGGFVANAPTPAPSPSMSFGGGVQQPGFVTNAPPGLPPSPEQGMSWGGGLQQPGFVTNAPQPPAGIGDQSGVLQKAKDFLLNLVTGQAGGVLGSLTSHPFAMTPPISLALQTAKGIFEGQNPDLALANAILGPMTFGLMNLSELTGQVPGQAGNPALGGPAGTMPPTPSGGPVAGPSVPTPAPQMMVPPPIESTPTLPPVSTTMQLPNVQPNLDSSIMAFKGIRGKGRMAPKQDWLNLR